MINSFSSRMLHTAMLEIRDLSNHETRHCERTSCSQFKTNAANAPTTTAATPRADRQHDTLIAIIAHLCRVRCHTCSVEVATRHHCDVRPHESFHCFGQQLILSASMTKASVLPLSLSCRSNFQCKERNYKLDDSHVNGPWNTFKTQV